MLDGNLGSLLYADVSVMYFVDSVQVLPAKLQGKGIVNEFTSLLHNSCENSGYGLNIQAVEKTDDVRSDQPVLVLFMKATRLGIDVLESLKGVKCMLKFY